MGCRGGERRPELTDCRRHGAEGSEHDHARQRGVGYVENVGYQDSAQIEADIKRRRETLAETLDEIGVRVHPKTIVGDAKAKVASRSTTRSAAPTSASTGSSATRRASVYEDSAGRAWSASCPRARRGRGREPARRGARRRRKR